MLSKIIKDDVDTAQTHLKVIKNLKRLRQFSEWKSPVVNQLYCDEYSKTMNQDIDLVYGESQLTDKTKIFNERLNKKKEMSLMNINSMFYGLKSEILDPYRGKGLIKRMPLQNFVLKSFMEKRRSSSDKLSPKSYLKLKTRNQWFNKSAEIENK